jgi:hypothetical protein
MQSWQDFIVEQAAGALVDHLAFSDTLALQHHQTAGDLSSGTGVEQTFSCLAGQLHFLMGVQAAINFLAQQQKPYQAAV